MKKMILNSEFRQIECAVKPFMPQHIADQKVEPISKRPILPNLCVRLKF